VNNQLLRILVAAVGIPLALLAVWYGGLPLALLIAVVGGVGAGEFFRLVEPTGVQPLKPLGITLAALAPLITWVQAAPVADRIGPFDSFVAALLSPLWYYTPWLLAAMLLPLIILTAVLFRRAAGQKPIASAATTLLGTLYAGMLPCSLLLIRYEAGSQQSWAATWLVFFPLAITWVCDSIAMYAGKAFGKTKLWPAVSPGKTQVGSVAGVIGGVVAGLVFNAVALAPVGRAFPTVPVIMMGLVISIVAQLGDLVESLFKREAGVKDSSGLIPGHGGVLDRLDSLYFVLPVAAVMYRMFE